MSSPPSAGTLISDATPTHVRPRPPPGPPRLAPRLPTHATHAHATPAYATPACHPPRDTRCRPRRVSPCSAEAATRHRQGEPALLSSLAQTLSPPAATAITLPPSGPLAPMPLRHGLALADSFCTSAPREPTGVARLSAPRCQLGPRASYVPRTSCLVPSASCPVPLLSRAPPASRAPLASGLQPAAHSSPVPQPRPIALTRP